MSDVELMTSLEVAAALGVSRMTVNRRVRSGKLPVAGRLHGSTGAWLFDPKDIAELAGDDASGELHKDNPHRTAHREGEAA